MRWSSAGRQSSRRWQFSGMAVVFGIKKVVYSELLLEHPDLDSISVLAIDVSFAKRQLNSGKAAEMAFFFSPLPGCRQLNLAWKRCNPRHVTQADSRHP